MKFKKIEKNMYDCIVDTLKSLDKNSYLKLYFKNGEMFGIDYNDKVSISKDCLIISNNELDFVVKFEDIWKYVLQYK